MERGCLDCGRIFTVVFTGPKAVIKCPGCKKKLTFERVFFEFQGRFHYKEKLNIKNSLIEPRRAMMISANVNVPSEGTFTYKNISWDEAVAWLRKHGETTIPLVGNFQTTGHIQYISLAQVQSYRSKYIMSVGDEALVIKVPRRAACLATRDQPQLEDWEYGLLKRIK
jgi:hypothetical protein